MEIISIREHPERAEEAARYAHAKWGNEKNLMVYIDCVGHCAHPLPNWYLLEDEQGVAGCAGLIANDFISRSDLYPWLAALFVEPDRRGQGCAGLLIERAKKDARAGGFAALYLASDHVGFYERYGFERIGTGYAPWGESSGIFKADL